MNHKNLAELSKKELKDFINSQGFFATLEVVEKNAPNDDNKPAGVPEGATYFKGLASNGELNRNGYIIRAEAWLNAIKGFLKNPVVLLQHDMNQPIGQVLSAEVTDRGLEVTGYVFDDLTQGRFARNLVNALSTGHLTLDFEFENTKTHEILSKEEFQKLPYEEQFSDNWVMAVTKLEWVELSLVSVGSNRKSLVSTREVVKNYIESLKKNEEEEEEEVKEEEVTNEEPKEEATAEEKELNPERTEAEEVEGTEEVKTKEVAEEQTTVEEAVEEKKEEEVTKETDPAPVNQEGENKDTGEIPVADGEVAENAIDANSPELIQISKEDFDEAQNAIKTLADLATNQKKRIEELEAKLDSIPAPKGLVRTTINQQETPKKAMPVTDLLKANGLL